MGALSHAHFTKPAGVGYAAAAVQSVSITTQSPRNPLSALGYKGVVGFIKQPDTADVTVEEFIPIGLRQWTTAVGVAASGATTDTLSDVAVTDDENPEGTDIGGATGCVLTGVTFAFVAGQPARATWNYLGKGGLAALDQVTPTLGTGEEKTVLLWETVNLSNDSLNGFLTTPVSGVQSVTFTGTINKDTLFALGTSGVFQHVTTFPTNVNVTLESFENLTTTTVASGNIGVGPVRAINCRQVSRGQSVAVGGFRTNTESYTAANLEWFTN
jgi:hypothetical protein